MCPRRIMTDTGRWRWLRWVSLLGLAFGCATAVAPTERPVIFYPDPPDKPRLQFLSSFSDSSSFQEAQDRFQRFVLGADTRSIYPIVKPYGVAMHEGTIYVCDTILGFVHAFDMENKRYYWLGRDGRGKLQKPINLDITPDGTMYVADVGRGQVIVFDAEHNFLRAIGNSEECRPADCAVVGDDLFVVDVRDHEVERRDAVTGRLLEQWGGPGAALGELFKPTNIAADADGNLYVTDTINCRVQIFDPQGNVLDAFGETGDLPGQFARPKGITVGPDGLIYVVDAAFQNVQIFGQDTKLRLFFGGPGQTPGKMVLPADVTTTTDGLAYFRDLVDPSFEPEYLVIVINQYGPQRVSIYAKGHEREAE